MTETPGRLSPATRLHDLPGWQRGLWLVGLWLVCGLYLVGTDQVAVVRLCGRVWQPAVPAGLHWRPPWPLSRLDKVRIRQPRQVDIGISRAAVVTGREGGAEEEYLTGDLNLIRIRATAQYTVSGPADYLFRSGQADVLVAAVVQSQLTAQTAAEGVDALMTTGVEATKQRVWKAAQATLDGYGLGVQILVLNLEKISPPPEVAAAFNDVSSAKQDLSRLREEALGYQNEVVPKARGEAAELTEQALAYQSRAINEATGRAARFRDLAKEYERAPQVTRIRLHLETVERLAPALSTTIVDSDEGKRPIDLGFLGLPPVPAPPASSGGTP